MLKASLFFVMALVVVGSVTLIPTYLLDRRARKVKKAQEDK